MISPPDLAAMSLVGLIAFCVGNWMHQWKLSAFGLLILLVPLVIVFLEMFMQLWRTR